MSNKYVPHLHILPEDKANRDMALGFSEHPLVDGRRIKVLPVADGWRVAAEQLRGALGAGLREFPERRLLLLIDFDGDSERRTKVVEGVPSEIVSRVYILGVSSEPERLKANRWSFGEIGETIAQGCVDDAYGFWSGPLVIHNRSELERLRESVRPFVLAEP